MGRTSGGRAFRLTRFKKAGLLLALFGCLAVLYAVTPLFFNDETARSSWSETTPALNITHIFEGEINNRGKPVGLHVVPKDRAHARIKKILSGPNQAGVFTAVVEIYDPIENAWKDKFSSFFPSDFSKKQIIKSILFALSNNMLSQGARWRGPSGHGFLIEGYHTQRGEVNTAYPLYVAD